MIRANELNSQLLNAVDDFSTQLLTLLHTLIENNSCRLYFYVVVVRVVLYKSI